MPRGERKDGQKKELLDPGKVLGGKDLWRAANAAARIELRPSLKAYGRARARYGRDQGRDISALRRLGNKTDKQLAGLGRADQAQQNQNIAASREIGAGLEADMAANASGVTDDQVALQSSILGNQINSLANQMIQPGYSASQNALSQAAQAQVAQRQDTAAAWGNLASTLGAGMVNQAQNMKASSAMRSREDRASARTMLASRMAQTRADYGEARREITGKMADTKALFGPTRLKNLMELRSGERTFANERAAIMAEAAANAADRRLAWAQFGLDQREQGWEESPRNPDNQPDGENGDAPDLWDRPGRLSPAEYRQAAAAAWDVEGGRGISDWRALGNEVGQTEGISWSPIERRKFIRRFRQRYNNRN